MQSKPTVFNNTYRKIIKSKVFVTMSFFISAYFACCPLQGEHQLYSIWFKLPILNPVLLRGFGMALFIYAAVHSGWIQKILNIKPLVFMGKLSFEIYALHWPIMLSFEAGLFIVLKKYMYYDAAALCSLMITIPIIYIAAILLNMFANAIKMHIGCFIQKTTKTR